MTIALYVVGGLWAFEFMVMFALIVDIIRGSSDAPLDAHSIKYSTGSLLASAAFLALAHWW